MALMVRSPITRSFPGPAGSTLVEWNFITGYFFTSKNSSPFRSESRFGSPVLMVEQSMVASTLSAVGFFASSETLPFTPPKCPRTVEIIMWRTLNWALLCRGSMRHAAVCANSPAVAKNGANLAIESNDPPGAAACLDLLRYGVRGDVDNGDVIRWSVGRIQSLAVG